jgi:hypothetical protein
MNGDRGRNWKTIAVANLKELSRYSPGETEKKTTDSPTGYPRIETQAVTVQTYSLRRFMKIGSMYM